MQFFFKLKIFRNDTFYFLIHEKKSPLRDDKKNLHHIN